MAGRRVLFHCGDASCMRTHALMYLGAALPPRAKYRNRVRQPRGAQRVCASVCARVLFVHGFARASAFKFIFTQLLAFESWIVGKLYKRS